MQRSRLAWLPNALTIARLAALPVLLVVLIRAEGPTSVPAAVIFGVVAATDFLDGLLARRLGAESRFGRIADPLADRLLVLVGLVGIILLDRLNPAGPAILMVREVGIVAAYAWLLRRGIEMRVDMAGKVSSALTMFATGGAILLDQAWVDVLFWVSVALAVATLLNYSREAATALRTGRTASTRP
ncbi:MAG TPA: CDP-alcohol phosphatidyltransferase family protein [Miltoncostaeaceae bacterium]|nr:CDP-alcohol phosphatidyltransferase family protein [Miltoncostaeaceae bacterium]